MAAAAAVRVLFHLEKPLDLVNYAGSNSNGHERHLEPGEYELKEIGNPTDSGALEAVTWLVLVEGGVATTFGTARPTWEEHGRWPGEL